MPANTIVSVDAHQIHATDRHFVDPAKFHPERYLDGSTLRKELVERTIPFGYGKRLCPGKGLAEVRFTDFFLTRMHAHTAHVVLCVRNYHDLCYYETFCVSLTRSRTGGAVRVSRHDSSALSRHAHWQR